MNSRLLPAARLLALLFTMPCLPAGADDSIVIDETTPGCVSDAVLDGFPSLAAKDGTGDFGNNSLAVALQGSVTEERAIVEFPLAEIAGLGDADIVSASLTFNIDDVLSTFGPGTAFDGTAPDSMRVTAYSGDGTVSVADFAHGDDEPVATVDTDAGGTVTDASLAQSGPLAFPVDVRDALLDVLSINGTYFGVVFATDDDKSSASLDDLGPGGAGPVGAGGARRPYLTVVLAPATTTSTTSTTSTLLPENPCGDANEDGSVTSSDALIALRTAVGLGDCPVSICDADGSGKVTATDALRILRRAVGLPVAMDCDASLSLPAA